MLRSDLTEGKDSLKLGRKDGLYGLFLLRPKDPTRAYRAPAPAGVGGNGRERRGGLIEYMERGPRSPGRAPITIWAGINRVELESAPHTYSRPIIGPLWAHGRYLLSPWPQPGQPIYRAFASFPLTLNAQRAWMASIR